MLPRCPGVVQGRSSLECSARMPGAAVDSFLARAASWEPF